MSHFAKVIDGIVVQVIVAEQNFINTLNDSELWIQTSYNTHGGIHYQSNNTPSEDQNKSLRKNCASINYTYDSIKDAFIPPKPYNSWILNKDTCLWESPIPQPDHTAHKWDEEKQEWIKLKVKFD